MRKHYAQKKDAVARGGRHHGKKGTKVYTHHGKKEIPDADTPHPNAGHGKGTGHDHRPRN